MYLTYFLSLYTPLQYKTWLFVQNCITPLVGRHQFLRRKQILVLKVKRTQKYKWLLSKTNWKTAHFDTNCMEIGFLFLKMLQMDVFKMAANGGCHFEINAETKNDKTIYLSKADIHSYTIDKLYVIFFYHANNHFMVLIYENCTFRRIYWNKINIQCELVTSQPHWFVGSQHGISKFSIFNNFLVYRPICIKFAPNS